MSVAVLKEMLGKRPFQPFRVRLSSGDAYEVPHPELALLMRSGIYIAVPDGSGDLPEVPVWCSFLHVVAVEPTTTGSIRS